MPAQTDLAFDTPGPGFTEITRPIADWVRANAPAGPAALTAHLRHTSASLLIQENADGDVRRELEDFFGRLAPPADAPGMAWIRHRAEGPDDMPAHMRAALLPVSLTIPVRDGALALGTWQGLFLVEHRDRPHRRTVTLHLA